MVGSERRDRPFRRLGKSGCAAAPRERRDWGGKAAQLDLLARLGLPVPAGCVIPGAEFAGTVRNGLDAELARLGDTLDLRRPPRPETLLREFPRLAAQAERLTERLLRSLPDPTGSSRLYAVRSSANGEDGTEHSFAGILKTYLGVCRQELGSAVLLCWAAAFSRRFRVYCREHRLDPAEAAVGVLVQEMVPASAAGILLTHDPITGERGPLISAVRGIGAAAVSDAVEADQFRFGVSQGWSSTRGRQEWQLVLGECGLEQRYLTRAEQSRPVLGEPELDSLARLAARVERALDAPADLEWALENGEIRLLQARPITALPAPPRRWTRANLKELFPELPSPMTASLIERCSANWLIDQFEDRGFRLRHLAPAVRMVRGRPYFNETLLDTIAATAGGEAGAAQEQLAAGSGTACSFDTAAIVRNLGPLTRLFLDYLRAPFRAVGIFHASREHARSLSEVALEERTDCGLFAEAVAAYEGLCPLDHLACDIAGLTTVCTMLATALLRGRVVSPEGFLAAATAGDTRNPTTRQVLELEALARLAGDIDSGAPVGDSRFRAAFEQFLDEYGCRGIHESDSARPRFAEDPAPLLASLRAWSSRRTGTGMRDDRERERREAWAELERTGSTAERWLSWRRPLLRLLVTTLCRLYALREEVRFEKARLIAGQRRCELALGSRWQRNGWLATPDDYYWLRVEEAEQAIATPERAERGWLRSLVAARKAEYAELERLPAPDQWDDREALEARDAVAPECATDLAAAPLSPGVVEGEVLVLRSPHEAGELPPGRILVTPVAGPSWTPLFAGAAGLIVEIGGLLSHGAILARELGLPAVGGVASATVCLRNGERVRIDGTRGLVWRLDPAPTQRETNDPNDDNAGVTREKASNAY